MVVLTSASASPLAGEADVVLLTGFPVGKDNRRLDLSPVRVVQLAALQALVEAVVKLEA